MRLASLLLLFGLFFTEFAHAQIEVSFNVNMKQDILDGYFDPTLDRLEITGDLYPLTRNRNYRLRDTEPIDSVYTVELTFPRRFLNQTLNYNFIMDRFNNPDVREGKIRTMRLFERKINVAPHLFDAYVN